jgi:hypothetical protein
MYIGIIGPVNKNVHQLLLTNLYQVHALLTQACQLLKLINSSRSLCLWKKALF